MVPRFLEAVPVDYVMIWTQRFGCFERQFEELQRLRTYPAVVCDAKGVCASITLSAFREICVSWPERFYMQLSFIRWRPRFLHHPRSPPRCGTAEGGRLSLAAEHTPAS